MIIVEFDVLLPDSDIYIARKIDFESITCYNVKDTHQAPNFFDQNPLIEAE